MSAKKRALGRGLETLIPSIAEENTGPPQRAILEIPIADIRPSTQQPRTSFAEEQIGDLANSIREQGILQPLLVRDQHGQYEIVAGERRYRAAKAIGLDAVPCIVIQATDETSFIMALVENLQREDLNPLEEAKAFQSLIGRFGLSQEAVAERVGKSRSTVANSIRLMNLPIDIQEDITEGRLSAGHARAILQIPDPPKQRHLRNLIVSRGLSVREAESQARKILRGRQTAPPRPATVDAQMRSLEESFSMKLGLSVFIKPLSASSGKVEIQYKSLDDFDTLSDFFGVEKT